MIVVHVIGPKGTDRHQEEYPDGYTDAEILDHLKVRQGAYGPFGPDGDKLILDFPETVVAVGTIEVVDGWKQFKQTRVIYGPGAKGPESGGAERKLGESRSSQESEK